MEETLIREKWGHLPHFRQSGNEWKASCPACGESGHDPHDSSLPDRFHIHLPDWKLPIARGSCRKCGHFEFLKGETLTPIQQVAIKKERESVMAKIVQRRKSRLEEIQSDDYWRGFHDGMGDMHRAIWRTHGISDDMQNMFSLGYNPDKTYKEGGEICHSDALTIPYLRHINGEEKPINIAYRLLNASGRYRYEYGVPAASFIIEPSKPLQGKALVVEGAKKAIICWLYVGSYFDHIIGLPSADISSSIAEELRAFDSVSLLLDPDTYTRQRNGRVIVNETAKKIGKSARIVRPPLYVKPDDWLLRYENKGKASSDMMSTISRATKQG